MILRIVCGAVIIVVAMGLYIVSTNMVNKDRKASGKDCSGGCAGCGNTGCASYKKQE
jgi:hypothetical protein